MELNHSNLSVCFLLKGAAVVLTPAYCNPEITSPVTVNVVVTFGNGKDAKSSEPIEFTYKPKPTPVQLQVQEVEMHPTLPITATENFLPVEFNSVGDIVLNNLPQEIVEPVPVILPAVSEEQGNAILAFFLVQLFSVTVVGNGIHSSKFRNSFCLWFRKFMLVWVNEK